MLLVSKWIETEQTALTVTDPDLERVRKFALNKELAADDIATRRMRLCNDLYDRTDERFPLRYLERIAATAPGKSVLGGHDVRTLPLARFYDARVVKDDQGHHVSADYYINRRTQRGQDLISDIDAGILKHVSVTIRPGPRLCDLCGKPSVNSKLGLLPGCEHWPGQVYDGKRCTATYDETHAEQVEMHEGSFVHLGAQFDAEAVGKALYLPEYPLNYELYRQLQQTTAESGSPLKFLTVCDQEGHAHRVPIHIPDGAAAREGGAMFDTLEKAVAEIERLQKLPLAGDREAELQKAISDLNARVEPLEKDTTAARDWQLAEIRRHAGILGRAEATEALLKHLTASDWTTLEKIRVEMAAESAAKLGPVEPQGKTGGADDEEEKPKPSWKDRFARGYF